MEKCREFWGGCFHITVYCVLKRVRERESRGRVPTFYVTMEFLTLTLPRYKTETKKFKEKREAAACLETAIKFTISSFCPKFLHLCKHLSLLVT